MINSMSEGMLRSATKADPSGVIHDKQINLQKTDQAKQARPVETSESGSKTEGQTTEDKDSSKYLMDENKIVFEKYNKEGELILRLPPSYAPVDEMV